MKTFQSVLLTLAILQTAHTYAQNVPATDAATAIDNLQRAAVQKIDEEVQGDAYAFADAKNIQNSLVWSDWFRPFMDNHRDERKQDGVCHLCGWRPTLGNDNGDDFASGSGGGWGDVGFQ